MTAPKVVERLVDRFRDRFHSVLEVASEEDRTDRAPGHRPRGVLVCGEDVAQRCTSAAELRDNDERL
jgi:hypothetical protein